MPTPVWIRTGLTGYALSAMVHCNIFFLQCTIPMSCFVSIKGGRTGRENAAREGTLAMIFNDLMTRARTSIAKRKQYNRLVAEIDSFSSRDLADMRADRSEMLYQIHKQIYG
ncbi:MAG: hypothetical protein J0I79_30470 [Mesorhizobium sp.]|uniref:hypothetical protein n=2 Tax=Mesorhizobium TaxID=68287 RepID=UPI001AD545AE|nr:hypothetical protein [Mesorhizobium sp.]MBN9222285.1 hypothetical protein [Mesorhizobium sp.]